MTELLNCNIPNLSETGSIFGYTAIFIFLLAYIAVILEEFINLRKSKPVLFAAGIIWSIVAYVAMQKNYPTFAAKAVEENILEYAKIFLFLIVAMTYVNAMQERGVFHALRCWLVAKKLSLRALFWTTGFLSFFISPFADNLTTAMLMCAVVKSVGKQNHKFVCAACINIVIAANAGGAFSPFGDITTLMVWQANILQFASFFKIFLPALVSYVVPAFFISLAVENNTPNVAVEKFSMSLGAKRITLLFLVTILFAVYSHHYLHLPPVIGMMTGLSFLKIFGYYLKIKEQRSIKVELLNKKVPFDVMEKIKQVEWDTLLFFYGVLLCIGGLASLGYLEIISTTIYNSWGNFLPAKYQSIPANIFVGLLSAIVDNIPVMYSVITMNPTMSEGQWLLVTLTAGIGGSILSVGSAAGVALMGQARGTYTFFSHLKWAPIILIGYVCGIAVHLAVNNHLF